MKIEVAIGLERLSSAMERCAPGSKRCGRMGRWFGALLGGCVALSAQPACAETSHAPGIVSVCEPCHGANGVSGDVETPNLAGQRSVYIRQQLEALRSGRRKHPEMRTVARELTDREIDQLVIYYSTLAPQ
jgi:cytochrome c553